MYFEVDMATLNRIMPPAGANVETYESANGEEYDYDPDITLDDIGKSKTIPFSIRANYTNWEPREAFRELVQNWCS